MEEKDKKIPGLGEQATKIATDNATALDNIFKTAPKTYEEAQFRKAQIDRGGYTPPTLMQMSGVTEEQVEANLKAQKEAKEKADAEAQEAEETKHRKAEKMWSAIGDGISAIANMATVGAGADSMYNPADSLHSKVKSKWDEIKANKAAVAAANRKAQMDLLLKEYELGVKSKEAEANRNFNIWKTETEEAGRNQRAKEEQEFKASEKQKDRDNDKEVAKIRGKYSRSSGGGSSSTGKYFFNGKAYKSASERNQAILNAAKKIKDFDIYDDDDNLRDWDVMAVELEELMAEGEPQPQPGNYAQRWGSMFGGNSTSVPSAKPSKASTTKSDPKKDTTSLYN